MNLDHVVKLLEDQDTVTFRPVGNSMAPRIKSKQEVTVRKYTEHSESIEVGDVVLCKVQGRVFLHLVTAINGDRFQISNNRGYVNGWTSTIYGVADV